MEEEKVSRPFTFQLARWHGFIFSAIFLVYGGVKIILGVLDRNYSDLGESLLFTVLGLVLISFAYAYNDLRKWGWYGLIAVNALVVVFAVIGYSHIENLVLLVISAVVLYALFSGQTKQYLFKGR